MKTPFKVIRYGLMLACCIYFSTIRAQYVTIPDANFVSWLQSHGFSGCMSGNQLDTSCSTVLSTHGMYCYGVPIRDLTGIQYFKNLDTLDCSNDSLYTIPALPATLTYFICQYNNLSSLPTLPSQLGYMTCDDNQITSLPALPGSLTQLRCGANRLTSLPALPSGLTLLELTYNQVTSLPALPATLQYLWCRYDALTSLPALPAALNQLYCNFNQLTSLPALPANLNQLDCGDNQLTGLPALPASLVSLLCGANPLGALPVLPAGLISLVCDSNNLSSLPALPLSLQALICRHNPLTYLPALPNILSSLNCSYCGQLTSIPVLPDSIWYFNCSYDTLLTCLPELKRINYMYFYGTAVSCVPDYGSVTNSSPPLGTVPLCSVFNPSACQSFWHISGQCYYDANSNCTFDVNDVGQPLVKMKLDSSGSLIQQSFSGDAGFFSFENGYGDYTLEVDTGNLPFTLLCPNPGYYNLTVSPSDSLLYNNNFAFTCRTQGFDVGVWTNLLDLGLARPNNTI
ncbi:MAG TPA: hypothetical protein VG603_13320, partial [Chitinophagales bacterium]|nr:hypothetical protein [Chitinophagales bacterium]